MRICTTLSGKLIEMQSNATAGTLIDNAVNAGYTLSEIIEKEITEAEWAVFKDVLPLPEVKAKKIAEINADAQTRIFNKYPLWVQANCANGVYPVLFTSQMKTDITAVITAANIATDAVMAAINEVGVTAITVTWPVI